MNTVEQLKERDDKWFTEFWGECNREELANKAKTAEEDAEKVQATKQLAVDMFGGNLPAKSIGPNEIVIFGPPNSRENEYVLTRHPLNDDAFMIEDKSERHQIVIRSKGGLLRAIQQYDENEEAKMIRQQGMLVQLQEAIRTLLDFVDVSLILENVEEV